jgi:magnesium chelatase family protein
VETAALSETSAGEDSATIRARVQKAREIQAHRFGTSPNVHTNSQMPPKLVEEICRLDEPSRRLLENAANRLQLSARAYHRILRVARTIADLDGSEAIKAQHLAEAITYRTLDRATWGT